MQEIYKIKTTGYDYFDKKSLRDEKKEENNAKVDEKTSMGVNVPNLPSNHINSFFGRLGSKSKPGTCVLMSKRDSGKVSDAVEYLRIQLNYDDEAYPTALEMELLAFLFDIKGEYLDCIFNQNPDDASGGFAYNENSLSMTVNLNAIPNICSIVTFAVAIHTFGCSLTEIEGGYLELTSGYFGPSLKCFPLQNLNQINMSTVERKNKCGLIYMCLVENNGFWMIREANMFSASSVDELMRSSKAIALEIADDLLHKRFRNLTPLFLLLQDTAEEKNPDNLIAFIPECKDSGSIYNNYPKMGLSTFQGGFDSFGYSTLNESQITGGKLCTVSNDESSEFMNWKTSTESRLFTMERKMSAMQQSLHNLEESFQSVTSMIQTLKNSNENVR